MLIKTLEMNTQHPHTPSGTKHGRLERRHVSSLIFKEKQEKDKTHI